MAEPKIRFKQDNGKPFPEWKRNKLKNFIHQVSIKNKDNSAYPVYSVNNQKGFIPQNEQFEEREVASDNKSNYKIVSYHQFAYNPSRINVGSIAYLKEKIKVIVSPLYVVFECLSGLNVDYLNMYIRTNSFDNKRRINAERSVRDSLNCDGFANIETFFPSYDEQKKIADFLSSVDEVISASEEEVANLETQKKAVMKKIFSQEVWFKKDDGSYFPDWKGKLFKEISTLITVGIEPIKAGKMHCVELEHLEQGSGRRLGYIEADKQSSNKRLFKKGDVLFGKLRPYLRKYWLATENGCCSSEIWVLRSLEGVLPDYLLAIVSSDVFIAVANTSEGTKMPRANWNLVSNVVFTVPCLEEQQKIADFLSNFDEAITLAKKELELWKQLKKGLLQQMFV